MKNIGLLLLTAFVACSKGPVSWVSSVETNCWKTESSLSFRDVPSNAPFDLVVTNDTAQQIDGFGGCFNELGWDALRLLSQNTRDSILKDLFVPEEGFNFTICRMPLGANDYSRNYYSYNEVPGDFAMEKFSIAHDTSALIPYIHSALKFNPNLKVWASPWCPPSWMKTNNHYACHRDSLQNDLPATGEGREGKNQFIMKPEYLKAYALYFSKFIQAYGKQGINIYAVHVQNEPNSCQVFPSCIWTARALDNFIGNYLGPEFAKQQLNTEIWLGTIERPSVANVDTVLRDSTAAKFIKGVGFQWAGKEAIPDVHRKYPAMRLMQTETECGDGSNDWKAAEHTWTLMKHYLTNGANAYMYWNIVLNETGKSKWGWKQNSMITIDSKTRKVLFNPEFYLMKHLSHFVLPGSRRLITQGWNDALAFVNRDGTMSLLVYNPFEVKKKMKVRVNNHCFIANLKPKSFNTFHLKPDM